MATKKKQETPREAVARLTNCLDLAYARWHHHYENGCSDPCWEDGVNLNLTRNHILFYKGELEKVLKDNYLAYPDIYFYPEPPELPNEFMAVDRKCHYGEHLTSTKRVCYNEIIKFDWSEALNEDTESEI